MKCKEKQAFLTKSIAKKKKKLAETKYGHKLTVYKCAECEYFHFHSGNIKRVAYFRKRKLNKDV